MIEITTLAKEGGPLTKRISLAADGSLHSDGSGCVMARGSGRRARLNCLSEFAGCIVSLDPNEAIALGALRHDLPDQVQITTKARLELNGSDALHLIARTGGHIVYRPAQPALALLDIDTKGMPPAVRRRIEALGGFWEALLAVLPELEAVGRVVRASTSAGIFRTDTGERLPGSDGIHAFILVTDGADIERFLRTMHDRCWLAGFGWYMVGAGGQLLDRSVVDRMVGSPERLVFEGAPVLDPPLAQDFESRRALTYDGRPLNTLAACAPLTVVEKAKLHDLRAKDAHQLAPDQAKARDKFVAEQAEHIVTRTGCTMDAARRTVERQCDGVLHPNVVLPFDDADLAGCTVGNVLAEPEKFAGATLSDPLEGPGYGRCKAKIMRRANGTMWINSFAHGRAVYELKRDAAAIEAILLGMEKAQLVPTFVRLAVAGDLNPEERQRLRDGVAKRTSINRSTINQAIKESLDEHADHEKQEKANQQAAKRRDPRPRIKVPLEDDPWLKQMEVLNEVLGSSRAAEPPARDIEGERARLRLRAFPRLHLLSTDTNNPDPGDH